MPNRSKLLDTQIKQGKKQILALTVSARKRIENRIIKAVQEENFVKAATLRDGLYNGIRDEYVRLNGGVDDWVTKRSTQTAKTWHALAIDDLPKAAKAQTFGAFSAKYLNDIIGKINPTTASKRVAINPRLEGMLAEDIRAIRDAVTETVRLGALTGMNTNEMSAEMIKRANKIKPGVAFVDKAGRTWNSESYFNMLNRTLHGTVAKETYESSVIEAGYDLVRVEGVSGDTNSPCVQYEGEILSLTGQTKGKTTVSEAEANGLFHPNCIHTLSVVTEEVTDK